MPDFNANVIHRLIELAAGKAGISPIEINRSSLETISDEINKNRDKDIDPFLTQRYLYDLYNQSKSAENKSVNASQNFLDRISWFIGFNNFFEFKSKHFPPETLDENKVNLNGNKSKSFRNKNIYLLVAILGLIFLYLLYSNIINVDFSSPTISNKPNKELITQSIEERITSLDKLVETHHNFVREKEVDLSSSISELVSLNEDWENMKVKKRNNSILHTGHNSFTGNKRIKGILGVDIIYSTSSFLISKGNGYSPTLLKTHLNYSSPRKLEYSYALTNKSKAVFKVDYQELKFAEMYEVEVIYDNTLRAIVIDHKYPEDEKKIREFYFYALPIYETFRFKREHNKWFLDEVISSGK